MFSISSLLSKIFIFVVFFTTKFVQFSIFVMLWFLQRTKKPPRSAGGFYVGGAAGYCLRVRVTTWTSFYVHSFLFCLGKNR